MRSKIFYGWWVLLGSSTTVLVAWSLAAYVIPVFYPELVHTFHWTRAKSAMGGSIQSIMVGLIAPLNGWIIDRKGVKLILLAGVCTLAIAYCSFSAVNSLWQYYLVCLFVGLGGSWTHHFPNELLVAKWFVKKRGLAIGTLTAVAGIGATTMPIVTIILIKNEGWRHAALTLPLFLIIPLIAILLLVRNRPEDMGLNPDGADGPAGVGSHGHGAIRGTRPHTIDVSAFRTKAFWLLGGVFFLVAWSTFSVFHHIVFYLQDQGASPTKAAFLFSLFLGASTVSRFLFGLLCTKIPAAVAMFITMVFVACAYTILLVFAHNVTIAYFWIIFLGLGVGGGLTCRPLLVFEHYGAAGVGKLYGVATAIFTAGAFIGPASSGYIFDKMGSYKAAFALALVLMCGAMIFLEFFRRKTANSSMSVKP
jgi:MFS transporter, OFA family, oxalate/formate antiporter